MCLDDDGPAIHLVEDDAAQCKKRWKSVKENLRAMMDEAIAAKCKTRAKGHCRHCGVQSDYIAVCAGCGWLVELDAWRESGVAD